MDSKFISYYINEHKLRSGILRHHNDSYFTGTLLEYLGMMLVIFLSGVFSLGLAAPWAFCYRERWVARHTYIEGRQLHFVGKSFDLWLFLLKWTLFSVLTLGLYSFVVPIRFQQWRIKNTYVYGYWDEYYATE